MAAFAGASSCIRSRGPSLVAGLLRSKGNAASGSASVASCSSASTSRMSFSAVSGLDAASQLRSKLAATLVMMPSGADYAQVPTMLRGFAAAANQQTQQQQSPRQEQVVDSLELTDEKISAITDRIPQRPVTVVEGTSYGVIILAAFGVLAFVLYQVVTSLILEPLALTCFNHTLERLKTDPRITVRIGSADDIRAWGTNSESRVQRQQIPHQVYKDANGVEHARIQFNIKGPSGTGLVHADMYKDAQGSWQYTYLLVDVYSSLGGGGAAGQPTRLHIVRA